MIFAHLKKISIGFLVAFFQYSSSTASAGSEEAPQVSINFPGVFEYIDIERARDFVDAVKSDPEIMAVFNCNSSIIKALDFMLNPSRVQSRSLTDPWVKRERASQMAYHLAVLILVGPYVTFSLEAGRYEWVLNDDQNGKYTFYRFLGGEINSSLRRSLAQKMQDTHFVWFNEEFFSITQTSAVYDPYTV